MPNEVINAGKIAGGIVGGVAILTVLGGVTKCSYDGYQSQVEFNEVERDAKLLILQGKATNKDGAPASPTFKTNGKEFLLSITSALTKVNLGDSTDSVITQYCINGKLSRISSNYGDRWVYKHGGTRTFQECWASRPEKAPQSVVGQNAPVPAQQL